MANYAVEVYAPGGPAVVDAAGRLRAAAEAMTREGTPVSYLRSLFLCDDETCFYVVEAPSADDVGEASRRAKLVYTRILEALE